jgi:hypothetical protein
LIGRGAPPAWEERFTANAALLTFGLGLFLLFNEVRDGLGALKPTNCGKTLGDDSGVGIELLNAFHCGESSGCFFKNAHDISPFG